MESQNDLMDKGIEALRERPWLLLGGSLLTGIAVGAWVGKQPPERLISELTEKFGDEIGLLKATVAGSVLKGLGGAAKQYFPGVADQLDEVVESAQRKFKESSS